MADVSTEKQLLPPPVNYDVPGTTVEECEESGISNGSTSKLRLFGGVFVSMAVAKLAFAGLTLIGEVGQIIMYPLWLDVAQADKGNGNSTHRHHGIGNQTDFPHSVYVPEFDCYSVLLCASIFELVLFVALYLLFGRRGPIEKAFPHKSVLIVSLCNSANSVMTAFTSSGTRTSPHLQTLLLNSYIPFTVLLRFVLLKKLPNRRKALCVVVVTLALFICLAPNFIARLDPPDDKDEGGATGPGKILWPVAFMFAILPAVLMNIFQERYFKGYDNEDESADTVDVYYLNVWMSFYQLVVVVNVFWLDLLPGFGNVNSLPHFFENVKFGFACFVGHDSCGASPGVRGFLYVISYVVSYLAGAMLIKHGEGSTLWALVVNMVTPLTFLFWTLFNESPFKWKPTVHTSIAFSIAGLALMLPATIIYNMGGDDVMPDKDAQIKAAEGALGEHQPLIDPNSDKTHYV